MPSGEIALAGYPQTRVFHRDDDITLLVPLVDVPMSLGHLFERVASINDRSELSGFNQASQVCQVFGPLAASPVKDLLAAR